MATLQIRTSISPDVLRATDSTEEANIRDELGITALLAAKADATTTASAAPSTFNVTTAHANKSVPVTSNADGTLLAASALGGDFIFEMRNDAAVTAKLIAGSGATIIVAGVSVATVSVTGKGGRLVCSGCTVSNEFHVDVVGGSSRATT